MSLFDELTARALAVLGLDLDFEISLGQDRFSAITDDLHLGGRPSPEDAEGLERSGITHVVSCLRESEQEDVAFLGAHFDVLFLPVHDGIREDIASAFLPFFEFVDGAFGEKPTAKVLVHCQAGVSRSATLATALLMRRGPTSFFEAFDALRARRGGVLPNIGFASQLQQLEFEVQPSTVATGMPSSLARYLVEVCMAPVEIGLLERVLRDHDHDALRALQAIFGEEIPRVVQGVRL